MKKCFNVLNNPERQEIYEYGGRKIVPTFGTAIPEKIDWSDT